MIRLYYRVADRLPRLCRQWLIRQLLVNSENLLVEFIVAFDHEPFEGEEVVHSHNLVDYFFVNWIEGCFLASVHKLLVCHP